MVKDFKKHEFVLICATKVIINIRNANICRENATFVYNNCRFCNLYVAKQMSFIDKTTIEWDCSCSGEIAKPFPSWPTAVFQTNLVGQWLSIMHYAL